MATRGTRKPAGRADADAEVNTAKHDEVLTWLLDNLAMVVAHQWGMSGPEIQASIEPSRAAAIKWLEGPYRSAVTGLASGTLAPSYWAQSVSGVEGPVTIGESTKALLHTIALQVSAVSDRMRNFEVDPALGRASISKYAAMEEIEVIEKLSYGVEQRTQFGYIDVAATVFVPKRLELLVEGVERDAANWHHVSHMHTEKQVRVLEAAFRPGSVTARAFGEDLQVWISVRTGDFTLGQVLRELRSLRRLKGGQNQAVGLFVDGIDPGMRGHIEHEGFLVFDKQFWVPKIAKPKRKKADAERMQRPTSDLQPRGPAATQMAPGGR